MRAAESPERWTRPELGDVVQLLAASGLPYEDLTLESREASFIASRNGDAILGVGGFEVYGNEALLRSIAVDAKARGRGLGKSIVQELENLARRRGALRAVLLTTDAEGFFLSLGYRKIAREELDADIRTSTQLTTICPASAAVLAKEL